MKMLYIPDRLTHIQIIVMIYYAMFSVVKKKKNTTTTFSNSPLCHSGFLCSENGYYIWEHPHHLIRVKYLVSNHSLDKALLSKVILQILHTSLDHQGSYQGIQSLMQSTASSLYTLFQSCNFSYPFAPLMVEYRHLFLPTLTEASRH